MAFKSLLQSSPRMPKSQSQLPSGSLRFERAILNNLSLTTWLLIGGLLQSLVLFITPSTFALVPTITILFILASRLAHTMLITYNILPNPYLKDALLHKVAAQVPDMDGEFSDTGASQPVVVLHLGAKMNHPLGIFAPNVKETADFLSTMIRELDENKTVHGFLGGSSWTSYDERGATELSFVSYWRDIDSIHSFAYGPTHKKAWEWWNKLTASESQHIGIMHEIYEAAPGAWEAIYLNFQPTQLGATTYLRKGDKMIGGTVDDAWISPLVDARRGKMRSSAGRLGRQAESLYQKYEHDPEAPRYEKV